MRNYHKVIILLSVLSIVGLFATFYMSGFDNFRSDLESKIRESTKNDIALAKKLGEKIEDRVNSINEIKTEDVWNKLVKNNESDENTGLSSFLKSLSVIILSEIGDKTFFIACLLSMKNSGVLIFLGSFSSLVIMTILSSVLGKAFIALIPKIYISILAAILFLAFSIKMFYEVYYMNEEEELQELYETEKELLENESKKQTEMVEKGEIKYNYPSWLSIFCNAFILTFVAEWGDRSQFTTIALAAAGDVVWVTLGTIIGHGCCTLLAVLGGRYLATKISIRMITIAGALLFMAFGIVYMLDGIYHFS